ncbi:MAG: thiosulfate oxidation carrier protein SoxY [Methylophilaceae bacterium]
MQRRNFLKILGSAIAWSLLAPLETLAAIWNKAAFEISSLDIVKKELGILSAKVSPQIKVVAPDRAENGAVVQVEITSHIANTEAILIMVAKNPTPLIANFILSNGMQPYLITRIKMAETDDIQVFIKADGQYFTARKRVEVFENGCG